MLSLLIKMGALEAAEMKGAFSLPWELKTMQNSTFLLFSKYQPRFPKNDIFIHNILKYL